MIGSTPAAPAVPPALRKSANSGPGPASSSSFGGSNNVTPFQWGPLSAHPHFTERFIYSDGLQAMPGRKSNSYINTLSPGVLLDIGDNWTFDYTPTWTIYTNRAFRETLDHAVNFAGTLSLHGWAAQFSQIYDTFSTPLIETARQTNQERVTTNLGVGHIFNRYISGMLSITQALRFVEAAPDYYTWSTDGWLQYQVSSFLAVAGGTALGYTDMDPGANMVFVRPQARITWQGTDKLSFEAHAGEQITQVYARGVSAMFTPVFGGTGRYRPFQQSEINLSADRSVAPSVLRNQVSDSTRWRVGFSQRLLGHFTVSGGYGEQESGYNATSSRLAAGRKDRSYAYDVRLATTFLRRGSIAFLYQGSHNSSNAAGFGFTSTQIGVEMGYRY